jgi:hypothetical protein
MQSLRQFAFAYIALLEEFEVEIVPITRGVMVISGV